MKKIFWAPAKINLTLEVIGKRKDGYHLLRTVMLKMNQLRDQLEIEIRPTEKTKIVLSCDQKDIPIDEKNTCYKAAQLFFETTKKNAELKLALRKKIPSGAGLGGGSSDAATLLMALNQFFGLPLSDSKLVRLASLVGKDIPFFLSFAEAALMEGLGDQLAEKIKVKNNFFVLLIKPTENVSTAMAYGGLAEKMWFMKNKERANWSWAMRNIFRKKNTATSAAEKISAGLYNDFEISIENKLPIIKELKQALLAFGAQGTLMSGSGSTVFGIFATREKMKSAQKILSRKYPHFFVAPGR